MTKVWEVKQALYKASEPQEMESLVTVQSEGEFAVELHTVERVKWICEVLCSRLVSVLWASEDNRIKQTVHRAMTPVYWMYERRVISCEGWLKLLWVFSFHYYFNCSNCNVNKRCYLLNPQAYQLQYDQSVQYGEHILN